PTSATLFPVGVTPVSCSAEDARGNTTLLDVDITVVDTVGPVITIPSSLTVQATGPLGVVFVGDGISAVDAVDGAPAFDCEPVLGTTVGFGSTSIACYAFDSAGNMGGEIFTVEVVDTTAPAITVPADISVASGGPSGVIVTFT